MATDGKPWMDAEPGSEWLVTGQYPAYEGVAEAFTDMPVVAVPLHVPRPEGEPLFRVLDYDLHSPVAIDPAWITSASRRG